MQGRGAAHRNEFEAVFTRGANFERRRSRLFCVFGVVTLRQTRAPQREPDRLAFAVTGDVVCGAEISPVVPANRAGARRCRLRDIVVRETAHSFDAEVGRYRSVGSRSA